MRILGWSNFRQLLFFNYSRIYTPRRLLDVVEKNQSTFGSKGWTRYAQSPTLIFSVTLLAVYIAIATTVANFADPLNPFNRNSIVLDLLEQCDDPTPIFPWTLLTSIFLHANPLHLISNLAFLVIFGFILEEQASKSQWVTAFLLTGLAGSLSFVAYDFAGYFLTGTPNADSLDCGVGASGAVYGIMGTALGLKIAILLIFLLGLDIFASGGAPAHLGGLFAGLVLRRIWALGRVPGEV